MIINRRDFLKASASAAAALTATAADTRATALQREAPRLPSSHICRLRSCSSVDTKLRKPRPAPASALMAMPASSIRPMRVVP